MFELCLNRICVRYRANYFHLLTSSFYGLCRYEGSEFEKENDFFLRGGVLIFKFLAESFELFLVCACACMRCLV